MKLTRRRFLQATGAAVLGVAGGTVAYLGLNDEAQDPVVEAIEIPVAGLPEGLEGFTIAQLSDIHLYPYTKLDLVNRAVAMTNALQPDLTVLTGDYVWRNVEAMEDLAPALAGLNARHGVYATIGNHDIWTDLGVVLNAFQAVRLPVLQNEGLTVSQDNGQFYLAGLDDGWSGRPDWSQTLAAYPGSGPIVLLLHEPDLADTYARDDRVVLQLSGHTHGGQIRVNNRAFFHPYLGRKYDQGLYRVGNMWLYTNRGLGVISEPFRLNCPPEITLLTLVRA